MAAEDDEEKLLRTVALHNAKSILQARQQADGVLVPVSTILRDDENLPFVYVAQPDGSFARRSVTLGSRIGDKYVIPSGLRDRDQIVMDGALFVQFMQNQ